MAINLSQVNSAPNADTFQNLFDKLNAVVNTIANSVVTANTNANGATTTGNGIVIGTFGATVLVANNIRGGNIQSSGVLTLTSNLSITGAIVTLGNVSINGASISIGSNAVIADVGITYGNSTVNSVLNASAITLGQTSLTSTTLQIGNSTSNVVVNTSGVSVSGAAMPLANNKAVVSISGSLIGAATKINFSAINNANVQASLDAGNSQINVVFSTTLVLANGSGGVNTNILFNDNTAIGGSNSFVFDKTTNTVTLSNTLVIGQTSLNSNGLMTGNSTVNATATLNSRAYANSTVTTSYAINGFSVGANVVANLSSFVVGNSTVQTLITSTSIATGNVSFSNQILGGNVTITTSLFTVGNSSINSSLTSTALMVGGSSGFNANASTLSVGGNLTINTSSFILGNSTVAYTGNSVQIQIANATVASIVNSTGLSVGGNVSVTYNQVTIGATTANATAVSSAFYTGAGIAIASNYWANTAGKVMTSDALNTSGAYTTLVDGATISVDMSTGINFQVTLGGNRTLSNPTNVVVGRSGVIQVIQDATGGRTLSFGNQYFFDSDTAPSIGTGSNKLNFLYYHAFATNKILVTLAAKSV